MTRLYSSPRQARSTRASTPRKIPRICYVDYDSSGSPPETSSVKVQQRMYTAKLRVLVQVDAAVDSVVDKNIGDVNVNTEVGLCV